MFFKSALVLLLASNVLGYFQELVQQCQSNPNDIVYVVDDSGSIGTTNFGKVRTAIKNVVQDFNVGTLDSQTHVGMVTFDTQGYYNFGLGNYTDMASLIAAIQAVPYTGGGTNITSGMMLALDQVFGQSGDRSIVPDIMVVVTDGQDNTSVAAAQALAAGRGITVWAVGVGNEVSYDQLVAIAGSPTRVRNTTSFDFLEQTLSGIPCPQTPPTCQGQDPTKTCPRTQCIDLHPECAGWAKLGYCKSNPSSAKDMEEICPVSCGVCKEICADYDCPDVCAAKALAGECKSNPEHMLVRCKKTCQYCDRCTNLHTGCPLIAAQCTNTANQLTYTQAHFYCRATCGDCVPISNCSVLDPISQLCPRDWVYSNLTNKCYWATLSLGVQATTLANCAAQGANLVSIHSQAENDQLTAHLPNPPNTGGMFYFIGLVKGTTWNNPTWTDGTAYNFNKWDTGASPPQPSNGLNEVYSAMIVNGNPPGAVGASGNWHDVLRTDQYPGFCQKAVCAPTTTSSTSTASTTTSVVAGK